MVNNNLCLTLRDQSPIILIKLLKLGVPELPLSAYQCNSDKCKGVNDPIRTFYDFNIALLYCESYFMSHK